MAAWQPPDIGGPGHHVLHADAALALPGLLHHLPPGPAGQPLLPHQLLHTLQDLLDAEAAQLAVVAATKHLDEHVGLLRGQLRIPGENLLHQLLGAFRLFDVTT